MPSVRKKTSRVAVAVDSSSFSDDKKKLKVFLRKRLIQLTESDKLISSWDEHRRHLTDLLKRTAVMAESNSVLLIGPRGCGKTTLIKSVVRDVMKLSEVSSNMLTVQLNGLMQTDDRIALKEITLQLKLENVVGDKVFGSFAENLAFLLEAFKQGGSDKKSILFLMDEFDLFCHHKNQTLLYNLFDVAQSAQAPIIVLGLTCRLDVVELLEKRVKSRFSHRQIYLFNHLTFEEYVQIFINCLKIPNDLYSKNFAKNWNSHVKELAEDANMLTMLQNLYDIDKSVKKLKSLMILPVARLSRDHPQLDTNDFLAAFRSLNHNSKISTLQGLSILELSLIIAMKRLAVVYDGEPSNFQMLYHEYQKFVQNSSMQNFEKSTVSKAFERLQSLELILPAEGVNSKIQKEYQLMNLVVDLSEISEVIKDNYIGLPTELQQWASTNI